MIEAYYPDDVYSGCVESIKHSAAVINDELDHLKKDFQILEKFFNGSNSEMEKMYHFFTSLNEKIGETSELYPAIMTLTMYVREVIDSRRALSPVDDDFSSLFL